MLGNLCAGRDEGEWVKLCTVASALGEKPYACPVPGCGKCFTEYSSLYKHQVVHTRSRPYSCKVCGKAYSQKSTLGTHKCSGRSEPEATVESEEFLCEQQQLEGEQSLPHHLQCAWVMPCGRGETVGSKGLHLLSFFRPESVLWLSTSLIKHRFMSQPRVKFSLWS